MARPRHADRSCFECQRAWSLPLVYQRKGKTVEVTGSWNEVCSANVCNLDVTCSTHLWNCSALVLTISLS